MPGARCTRGLRHKSEFARWLSDLAVFRKSRPTDWPYRSRRHTVRERGLPLSASLWERARPSPRLRISRLLMPALSLIITIAPDRDGKTTMSVSFCGADGAPAGPAREVVLNDRRRRHAGAR